MPSPLIVPRTPTSTVTAIVVAVLTYRRPDDLAALLPLLRAEADGRSERVRVLVIDNDPEGGARALCRELGVADGDYAHEPRPGIAAARNRALAEAGDADLLVFIDDDERPRDGWLASLLATYNEYPCAGVVGPVLSSFPGTLDPWIEAGAFFTRRRMPTGTAVSVAATNNLLLDLHAVRSAGVVFDEQFGISGGSDTLFTRSLVAAGHTLVWCDSAIVTDVVPPARATREWVMRRFLRSGNSWSRVSLRLAIGAAARAKVRATLVAQGLARIGGGLLRILLGLVIRNVSHRARGTKSLARGVGMTSGALGLVYREYRRDRRRK